MSDLVSVAWTLLILGISVLIAVPYREASDQGMISGAQALVYPLAQLLAEIVS